MKREEMGDLLTFMAVAEERSFTRAAAVLGISQSAISHAIKKLESNLGVRLLNRTTRNVSCTEAGSRLLETQKPAVLNIEGLIESFEDIRGQPKGNIKVTSTNFAATTFILPALERFNEKYPEINFELNATSQMIDIIEMEYDAGIRLDDQVERDMIAVRIGGESQMVIAATPEYLKKHGEPASPADLINHNCINLRMVSSGIIYSWEFEEGGKPFKVKVGGSIICNNAAFAAGCALRDLGIVCLLKESIEEFLDNGRLIQILTNWTPSFPGFHLYYPSRKQNSAAFQLFIDEIRL
ncbi:LysR family transcriptional regulator [Pantoea sp. Cy-640]|uniref:LysR family transcriptional regulator n=1 Tax=Pantoea sp. Cy-640 TaxID=2608353 RepID=UPI0014192AC9|nr:LysR family transcriptional regulator [Pantoea sp. Cy-640]NIG16178.1 LysR family transcriptional regulator [Pantoea sp. Cy-640]